MLARALLVVALSFFAIVSTHSVALAAEPTTPKDSAPTKEQLDEAKSLFRQGNELRKVGDFARALELYARSRAIVASVPNTLNAAICLSELGRADEALELYEELITGHTQALEPEDRQSIAAAMSSLRRKVANVDVSANVDGTVVVDGRMRGHLPLLGPVRILPGKHTVRIIKDGYASFEKEISVGIGQSTMVDANLQPLAAAGRLRAESVELTGGSFFVDGALVGPLPWEGTLAPGTHVYFAQKGNIGSAPRLVTVLQGQTLQVPVEARPLGAELRISTEPDANLAIGDVPVGRGKWQGRLPVGTHVVEAREDGYVPSRIMREVSESDGGDLKIALVIDAAHPRWSSAKPGTFFVGAFGGIALGGGLGAGAESNCATCTNESNPFGGIVGARGSYELTSSRVSFGLALGYVGVSETIARTVTSSFQQSSLIATRVPVSYALKDSISLSGPLAALHVGYRQPLSSRFDLLGRVDLGVALAAAKDETTGTGTSGGVTRDIVVGGSGTVTRGAAVFAMPGVEAQARFGSARIGLGLAAALFLLEGPRYSSENDAGSIVVQKRMCAPSMNGAAIDCAPDAGNIAGERAFGRFLLWIPSVSFGYTL